MGSMRESTLISRLMIVLVVIGITTTALFAANLNENQKKARKLPDYERRLKLLEDFITTQTTINGGNDRKHEAQDKVFAALSDKIVRKVLE